MEITGKITQYVGTREGISQSNNQPWRVATYVAESIGGVQKQSIVFDVRDGLQSRIDRLALEEGKVYKLWLDCSAREYQGKWYNSISCWEAREVIEEDNDFS